MHERAYIITIAGFHCHIAPLAGEIGMFAVTNSSTQSAKTASLNLELIGLNTTNKRVV